MAPETLTYAAAGVDIDAGDRVVNLIQRDMRRTFGPRVLGKHGGFAGCFRLDYNEKLFQRNFRDPVLLACTDGVGSKVQLAVEVGVLDTVGQDCVAMNVNDLVVSGAEPLFFLDYIGFNKLSPKQIAAIVKGVADGCQLADCALIGGETAELTDLYRSGEFDLAGFTVGVCELKRMIDGSGTEPGDVLIGLGSSGVHSNGFSLVRAIVKKARLKLDRVYPELEDPRPLGEILLTPTRIYAKSVIEVWHRYRVKKPITAMAHITGGGLIDNVPRTLGDGLDAKISRANWDTQPIFRFLQKRGDIDEQEMLRVFNMGIGFVLTVRPWFADAVMHQLRRRGEQVYLLGKLVKGSGCVVID